MKKWKQKERRIDSINILENPIRNQKKTLIMGNSLNNRLFQTNNINKSLAIKLTISSRL